MGFFEKLKKLFEEEKEISELKEEEIEIWIQENEEEIKKSLMDNGKEYYQALNDNLSELEIAIKSLKIFDVNSRKAEERLKSISEIGKRDYVLILEKFFENLKLNQDIEIFSEKINFDLKSFFKESPKAEIKATQLIGKEIGEIKRIIYNIKKMLKKFEKENFKTIDKKQKIIEIKELFGKFNDKKIKKNRISEEIERLKKERETLKSNFKKLNSKIESLKKSEEASKEKITEEEISVTFKKLSQIDSEIKILISWDVFGKGEHSIAGEYYKFIEDYLNNPVENLMGDSELKILNVLFKIKKDCEDGKVILKESKLEKVKKAVNSIKKIKLEREEILINIRKLKEDLSKIRISREVEGLEDESTKIQEEKTTKERMIEKRNQIFESIKIIDIKNRIEEKATELGKKIVWEI